ncbi:Alpha/Beta hydrolase protein [Cladorrhinum sp. PSN332]|nr:Alpha/Beta hydrolase protein [Cladorrhinum sp. PSN332]
MTSYHSTTFLATDGTELAGRVYPASAAAGVTSPGPGIVMSPGFNCVMTMLNFPSLAASLQAKGVTVLLYDPRGIGSSSGLPRGDIDPPRFVSDLCDALTHLKSLKPVDAEQIGVLGFSFGGTVALTAAAVDTRVKFVIAVAPLTDLDFGSNGSESQRARVLKKCAQDRESQVLGNDPLMVQVINEKGENPVGFGHSGGIDREKYGKMVREGRELGEGYVNKVTLQSYWKIASWAPWPLWKLVGKSTGCKGVLFVIPGDDEMSYPHLQEMYCDEIRGVAINKKCVLDGLKHEEVLADENLGGLVDDVSGFVDQCVR